MGGQFSTLEEFNHPKSNFEVPKGPFISQLEYLSSFVTDNGNFPNQLPQHFNTKSQDIQVLDHTSKQPNFVQPSDIVYKINIKNDHLNNFNMEQNFNINKLSSLDLHNQFNSPLCSNKNKNYINNTNHLEKRESFNCCSLCSKINIESTLSKCSFPNCTNIVCWPNCSEEYAKFFLPYELVEKIKTEKTADFNKIRLEDSKKRPKFICHSHFCSQCFESNWRHYLWDQEWRKKAEVSSNGFSNFLWNILVYSCKNMTEKKHFDKKRSPLKIPYFPRIFSSFPGEEYIICNRCKAACCHNCSHPISKDAIQTNSLFLCNKCQLNHLFETNNITKMHHTQFYSSSNISAMKEMFKIITSQNQESSIKYAKFENVDDNSFTYNLKSEIEKWEPESFQFINMNYSSIKNKHLMRCKAPIGPCECKGNCDLDCQNRSNGIQCYPKICPLKEIDCGNRLIPKVVLTSFLTLKKFKHKGMGIITNQNFQAGEFVCEYVGEVISSQEYHQRIKMRSMQEIDDKVQRHWYVMEVKNGVYIDSTHKGNLARFINHSCDPNCRIGVINVKGIYRMGIFSKKKINSGEEITYSYGFKSKGIGRGFQCCCGASNCIGQVGIGNSINKIYNEIQRHQKLRMEGYMCNWLQELTSHLTDNEYSNPYRLHKPNPSSILDGIIDINDLLKSKKRKYNQLEKIDPFFYGIKQKKHLFQAHLNYIRILLLNGGTIEDYLHSSTKKFGMDVPWSLLANELSWPQREAAREGCIFFDDFYYQSRRFYQCQILAMAKTLLSNEASERLQSYLDNTWGSREVCAVCGKYGEVSVCDSCHEVVHPQCLGIQVQKSDKNFICLVCSTSQHREIWFNMPEIEREKLGIKLSQLRLIKELGISNFAEISDFDSWEDWS